MSKIAIIGRRFDTSNGGLGRFSMELANRFEKMGHEVVRIGEKNYGLPETVNFSFWATFVAQRKIPKDVDICLTTSVFEGFASRRDIPTVAVVHDLIPILYRDIYEKGGGIRRRISDMLFKKALNKIIKTARMIVVPSTKTAYDIVRYIEDTYLEANVNMAVIPNGIPDLFVKALPKKHYMPDGDVVFGTISVHTKRKRIDKLIEAFKKVKGNAKLIIAGSGRETEALKALAKGDDRIKFIGRVPESQLPSFYKQLDYFVFPTAVEGYGLPIIEALSVGVPVITLEDAIIPDEVKTMTMTTSDLHKTLQNIVDNPDEYRMHAEIAQEMGRMIKKELSWDAIAMKYETIMEMATEVMI